MKEMRAIKDLLMFMVIAICLLVVVSVGEAATLKWDAAPTADGYYVYYSTTSGDYPDRRRVGDVLEYADIVEVLKLNPATTYYFVVTAYNTAGEGGYSNEADYLTPTVLTVPPPVTITITVPQ